MKRRYYLPLFLLLMLGCGDGGNNNSQASAIAYDPEFLFIGDSHLGKDGFGPWFQEMFDEGEVLLCYRDTASTSKWAPSRGELWVDFDIDSRKPRSTIILLGTYDAYKAPRTSAVTYRMNIEEMAHRILENGGEEVILITAFKPHPDIGSTSEAELLRKYEEIIIELCETTTEAIFCGPNLYQDIRPKQHLAADGVHLNDEGNQLVFEKLQRFFSI